jgi:hypothetical protein
MVFDAFEGGHEAAHRQVLKVVDRRDLLYFGSCAMSTGLVSEPADSQVSGKVIRAKSYNSPPQC